MDDKLKEMLKNYFCVFMGNPYTHKPYAMYETKEQAIFIMRYMGVLVGPLTFEEWLEEFRGPVD